MKKPMRAVLHARSVGGTARGERLPNELRGRLLAVGLEADGDDGGDLDWTAIHQVRLEAPAPDCVLSRATQQMVAAEDVGSEHVAVLSDDRLNHDLAANVGQAGERWVIGGGRGDEVAAHGAGGDIHVADAGLNDRPCAAEVSDDCGVGITIGVDCRG